MCLLTRMAVLSGSVEMGWLQAVSLNLSPPVYARIWGDSLHWPVTLRLDHKTGPHFLLSVCKVAWWHWRRPGHFMD